ncbi:MAG: ABC transporter permease [Rhodobiaceae bacterium]|jgi:spermidine/putrescine transport system permease protein|nr:ABC transporter permease [Rhodobiaceae bacterium]MBT5641091.1 ABC transporter permease [Rhodobiaceae bacterium]MBT6223691.1 ABC transporter permease [Rhodobiaceae bacterium]
MDSWKVKKKFFTFSIIPGFAWIMVFFFLPLAFVWIMSFGEKSNIIDVVITGTLDNYTRAFDRVYFKVLAHSFLISLITTFICLIISLPIAFLISFSSRRIKTFLMILIILPFWTNLLIRTYSLIAILRTEGHVNKILEFLWIKINNVLLFLGIYDGQLTPNEFIPLNLLYNNFSVIFGLVYIYIPFMIIPIYVVLDKFDKSYIEASLDLGAGQIKTLFKIIIPLIYPGIISGVLLVLIPCLGSFVTPDLLGGSNSQMIGNVIERQFKSANDWPFGAALSFLLIYITIGLILIHSLFSKKIVEEKIL